MSNDDKTMLVPAKCCAWCINVNPDGAVVTCSVTPNSPDPNFYCKMFRWAWIGMSPEVQANVRKVYGK
ncbi:MAG: hypothetical protein BV459_03910 [Thermoplasmata archaeon M11B2D]|nr:MAG: hypothetical protein BV459_03910 [Thermoplasmata archaeon M11B2D]